MREVFQSVYWSTLPPEYQPLDMELLSLGLSLEGIPAEELPEHALGLLEDSNDPDLLMIATATEPTLEEEGERLARYLHRRGFPKMPPKDAAHRMSSLLARAACCGSGHFSYFGTAQEIIESWSCCAGDDPFPLSSEVPSEIRALWTEIDYNHSLLFDRLGTYPTPYQLARETNHGLERFLKEYLQRAEELRH